MVMGLMRQVVEAVVGVLLPWRVVVWVQATPRIPSSFGASPRHPPSSFGASPRHPSASGSASVGGLLPDLSEESLCRPLVCPCEWWWADVGGMVDGRRARESLLVVGGTHLRKRAPYCRA